MSRSKRCRVDQSCPWRRSSPTTATNRQRGRAWSGNATPMPSSTTTSTTISTTTLRQRGKGFLLEKTGSRTNDYVYRQRVRAWQHEPNGRTVPPQNSPILTFNNNFNLLMQPGMTGGQRICRNGMTGHDSVPWCTSSSTPHHQQQQPQQPPTLLFLRDYNHNWRLF